MTELWNSRARVTPEEILLDLAKECSNLGVNACDVYGDFEQSADTSYLRRFEKEISATFGKDDVRSSIQPVLRFIIMLPYSIFMHETM